jgi:hypothetical protein
MKQVKCWAYVDDGLVLFFCSEKDKLFYGDRCPAGVDPGRLGQWIKMTGEMPEAEKTCEVRWDRGSSVWRWHLERDSAGSGGFETLGSCLRAALSYGLRITNDPREVDEVETEDRQWVIADRQTTWRSERMSSGKADEIIRANGWRFVAIRIRTHDPAEQHPICPPIPDGIPPQESARASSTITPEDIKAQRESWARGEAAMGSDADEAREREHILGKEPLESQHFGGQPGDECGCDRCLGREPRPTLGELLDAWRGNPFGLHLKCLDALLSGIVEAIGKAKQ